MLADVLFIVWFLGALVTFGFFCWGDVVRGPRTDLWFNLAAAVIWPAVVVRALLDSLKGRF